MKYNAHIRQLKFLLLLLDIMYHELDNQSTTETFESTNKYIYICTYLFIYFNQIHTSEFQSRRSILSWEEFFHHRLALHLHDHGN